MNNEMNDKVMAQIGQFRPNLTFYRANPKGTGAAVRMNLHPAHDNADGCIMLTIANQMTVGSRLGPNPTFPTYDWENAITVKLGFDDLTQFLQVFRGETESINGDKGLYHRAPCGRTAIKLRHLIDPAPGYGLEIYRSKRSDGKEDGHACFLFSPAEALGVCEAIAGAMYLVGFGIPMLVPHDTTAYRTQAREVRDVAA